MPDAKIKVLNLAGCGRSGSTIIGNILDQIEGFFHVGELCYIWNRGIIRNRLCGCGQPFHDCGLWSAVLDRALKPGEEAEAAALARVIKDMDERIALLMSSRAAQTRFAGRLQKHLDTLLRLYRAIQQVSGCNVIVDSSKLVSYGYLLHMIPEIDLYSLHLVRDSRAVAYSWRRKKIRLDHDPNQAAVMDQLSPGKSAFKWIVANLAMERLQKFNSNRVRRMRYEDFVQNPISAIKQIADLVGENPSALPFISEHEVQLGLTHTVWGNPNRLQTGNVKLRPDEEWRVKINPFARALVTTMTFPQLVKYKYLGKSVATAPMQNGARPDLIHQQNKLTQLIS